MNKSIEGYKIFTHESDYQRFLRLLRFYNFIEPPTKFSFYLQRDPRIKQIGFEAALQEDTQGRDQHIQTIAYCLMPTHFHILVKPLHDKGVAELMRKIQNSYARYFNTKYHRHGVLWAGPYKNIAIEDDEQNRHVVRYIHLNPTTAGLTNKPEEWSYSSYHEYIKPEEVDHAMTQHDGLFDMTPKEHQEFTENQQDYQRSLAIIKKKILE